MKRELVCIFLGFFCGSLIIPSVYKDRFIKGCETTMIDLYKELNLKNIDYNSLHRFCENKSLTS